MVTADILYFSLYAHRQIDGVDVSHSDHLSVTAPGLSSTFDDRFSISRPECARMPSEPRLLRPCRNVPATGRRLEWSLGPGPPSPGNLPSTHCWFSGPMQTVIG